MTTSIPTLAPGTSLCDCGGSGRWVMGPITNGKPARDGVCFRCRGKGYLTAADDRRNSYYDNHVRRIYA